MQPGMVEFGADNVAEAAVERRENGTIVLERIRQQRQGAGRCAAAEGGAGKIEIERAPSQVGEHLWVRSETAFRENVEPKLAVGFDADGLGHLGESSGCRAVRRLIDPEAIM